MIVDLDTFYREIADAIVDLDEKAVEMANKAIENDLDLLTVIEKGYASGIRKVGQLFDEGEYYLPEMMIAAKIMQNSIAILTPKLKENSQRNFLGTTGPNP